MDSNNGNDLLSMIGSLELCEKDIFDEQHWYYFRNRYHLTPRETQVAKLICRGFNNKGVAYALGMKDSTAKTHLRSIYKKLQVGNRVSILLRLLDDKTNGISQTSPAAESSDISTTAVPRLSELAS